MFFPKAATSLSNRAHTFSIYVYMNVYMNVYIHVISLTAKTVVLCGQSSASSMSTLPFSTKDMFIT